MPIRPSAGAAIRPLIDALGGDDEVKRESAVARLAVMGPRAIEPLLHEYGAATLRLQSGILRALEAVADPKALPIARKAVSSQHAEIAAAAVGVLRAFLTSPTPDLARDALDAVVATALDTTRPPAARLAALDALRVLPPDVREAVRKNLAEDPDPDVRARAVAALPRATGQGPFQEDDAVWREAVAGRLPAAPEPLKRALATRRTTARLTELQHLVDHLRGREQREAVAEWREEWRALRGAVHQALAARNSRLALYDLRDSLLDPDRLPVAFLAAIEEIGDATCLETLAAAYDASSRSGDAWWREHVAVAFRAIVLREGLTRRHAAVKRMMSRWPDAAADLMGRI
jgi:HEAT repeat protein